MKLSLFVALMSWASLFALSWMLLLGSVRADFTAWLMLVVYLVIALLSSIMVADRRRL